MFPALFVWYHSPSGFLVLLVWFVCTFGCPKAAGRYDDVDFLDGRRLRDARGSGVVQDGPQDEVSSEYEAVGRTLTGSTWARPPLQ